LDTTITNIRPIWARQRHFRS